MYFLILMLISILADLLNDLGDDDDLSDLEFSDDEPPTKKKKGGKKKNGKEGKI